MNRLITPTQARIPIGTAVINGQRVEVTINPEWARYFESLNNVTNTITTTVINGANGAEGRAGVLTSDEGDAVEFVPGPPGPPGRQGDPGPALFILQDNETNDIFWPIKAG